MLWRVDVYGSLSLTGKRPPIRTSPLSWDWRAISPIRSIVGAIPAFIRDVEARGHLLLANGQHEVDFPAG
ncbi:hypothetical protein LNP74_27860 [Klebsiella pneumoniae subsp. pneumoniae]|nr:hypothetical protein [Klebsiella pneumoniae subsp. pneumoniae]